MVDGLTLICVPKPWVATAELLMGGSLEAGLSWRYPQAEHLCVVGGERWACGVSSLRVTGLEAYVVKGDVLHFPKCISGLPHTCPDSTCRIFPKADQDIKELFEVDAAE